MTNDPQPTEMTDPFEDGSNQAAAQRIQRAMQPRGSDGGAGGAMNAQLRARLLEAASPAMAANRNGRSRSGWWKVQRAGPWAAAAMLVLTVSVVVLTRRPTAKPTLAAFSPNDTNTDGVIDILDAHALALAVHSGGGVDLDHDGVISPADAEFIATRVVRLSGGVGGGGVSEFGGAG